MAKNNTCKPDQKPNQQSKQIVEQAVFVAEWVAKVLTVAEQLRLKTKVVDTFVPEKLERTVLATLPTVPAKVRNKMSRGETAFTAAEMCGMALAVAEELPEAGPQEQVELLLVAKTLMDGLQTWIADTGEAKLAKKPTKSKAAYQFKITLSDSEPPIWRRIQVEDCTLDELHGHIQTAMGWTNSHLHYFEIGGKRFGDPELLEDAAFDERAAVGDADFGIFVVGEVADADPGFEREGGMGGGEMLHVEDLSVGGAASVIGLTVPTGDAFFGGADASGGDAGRCAAAATGGEEREGKE